MAVPVDETDPLSERVRLVESRTVLPRPQVFDRQLDPLAQTPEEGDPSQVVKGVPQYSKAFRYDYAATNKTAFPSLEYTICEPPPYAPGVNPLERGINVLLTGEDSSIVTTPGPYAGAKGNLSMRGGEWYFEVEVVRPNVRIGIARRECSCEGPVGCDTYSYGIQDLEGIAVHSACTRPFMAPFGPGDVIGFHVRIPSDSRPHEIVRSRVPLKYKDQIWLESINYKSTLEMERLLIPKNHRDARPDEVIEGSFCKVYRNGEYAGVLAEPLREFRPPKSKFDFWLHLPSVDDGYLGYYPMITAYKNGAARFNFGPDFKHTVPDGAEGLHKRYDEQIADDFAVDLINEIVFEEIDELMPESVPPRVPLSTFEEKKKVVKKLFA